MKFQFLTENFSRSENAPPFETRKIRHFEVERIFLENKKMVQECGLLPGIWRRRQIEILNAEEKVLFPADLMEADEIRIGNSLRGTGVAAYLENEEDHRCLFTGSPV